ncbi:MULTISPECIES: hypothetical protein [Metallosphaera]|nr:hypothetical protein [Metallosphaera sedula]
MYLEILKRLPGRWVELRKGLEASDEAPCKKLRVLQDLFYVKK